MTKKRGATPQYKFNYKRLKPGKTIVIKDQPEPRHYAHLIRTNGYKEGLKVSAKVVNGVVYLSLRV